MSSKTKNYHDYNKIKEKYNLILKDNNQKIFISFLTENKIIFSNNISFSKTDRNTWLKRLRDSKICVENFDRLISGIITWEDLKKKNNSNAAKFAWILKGNDIKLKMKGRSPWNKGVYGERNSFHNKSHTNDTKRIISEKNKGENNGMYGRKMSDEDKKLQSQRMKTKILEGGFTPNTNNRNTHWEAVLDGIKYRSSWEALYKFYNSNSIYEKLRISYEYNNETKIYIVDFIDEVQKLAIEIKPKNILKTEISKAKIKSLNEWCINNNYHLLIVDEDWIVSNIDSDIIDYQRFDEKTQSKIKKLYEINKKN